MQKRKIPMRKCIASNEMKPKKDMIRIVKNKEGEISIDPSGKMAGRGAYVSIDPKIVKLAWDKRILDRTFEIALTDSFYQELLDYVTRQKARMSL
ncbi:RNase P modulator RnpM [Carnobacterium sp.]|uniref:RNase P modulator RnpM n=1 Tax=Carnobacterium sp. TaxID=48221 RepID=UPI003C719F5D